MEAHNAVFGEIQTVLVCGGIVSGILRPKPYSKRNGTQKGLSLLRGKRIRTALKVPDSSPLNDKVLRNSIEHVDERLDGFWVNHRGAEPLDFNLVLNVPLSFEFPARCVRGYVASQNEVWLFGERRDLRSIASAMWELGDSFTVPMVTGGTFSSGGNSPTEPP
jgi:hypothetical protein